MNDVPERTSPPQPIQTAMASKERSTSPTDDPVPRNEFGGVYGENILCELFGKWLSRDAVTVLKERGHHTKG